MKKILVPVDGSKHCFKALDYASSIAEKYGSKILLLNVQEGYIPLIVGVTYYRITETLSPQESLHPRPLEKTYESGRIEPDNKGIHTDEHEVKGAAIVEEAKRYIEENSPGVDIDVVVAFGIPAEAIIEIADRDDCDAIIMCTHGMGGIKRFTMGSVTNKVVHTATVPVMVIR
ncbi:Nucleotide-binding universal stress protein, UspA family [Peptoclostridium litorale DSM 5388]|uniref:UspA domain-containing protein n=1 Tax=Peptoclostridium litorale DSM 5388 TaxID=1121324 RepID=A0A069RJB4_PEPLI|nr:universal stress protein [Peptoclostridium litorale]KDR96235.1 hypothetical protein CLIT_4c00720 [Peptoclostridium litorale DSM 5388]SIO14166.1 Nucleotide-binding universal stress protein, UspA family [Peptoclostridium litorale DSM 5388]